MSLDSPLTRVSETFASLASSIEQSQSDAAINAAFTELDLLCSTSVTAEGSGESKALLSNVRTAVQTWQQVWPRLGQQQEFRLAVVREARLWARRFRALEPRP